MVKYNPKQGDIITTDFNPTRGREQKGRRPALIISNESYFQKTGLLVICPISRTSNKFPLHLSLNNELNTTGCILTQHIRTIDPEARPIEFIERVPEEIINQVINIIGLFFKET